MASQEDDNKLESKLNVNKDQERNFVNVYKEFEAILNNKLEPFPKKIESVIEIWKSLSLWKQQNSNMEYIIEVMDWAKLHTLNIVLTGNWKKHKANYEAKLLIEVEKTKNELMKISGGFLKKFQKLADVIRNPWDDPILENLLHAKDATIGEKEIEFFCIETAYLVSVRLKKLCESQCEDLALNLVTAFMNCYNLSQTQNFALNAPETHILFCFDIHVALLYRYNRMSDIVSLFKKLRLEEGLQLIKRFAKKRINILKLWRNFPEVTFLASQVFVTAAVTKPFEESGGILKHLLDAWIQFSVQQSMVEKLENSIRRIIQAATAAQHIYICCEIIHQQFGSKLKPFTIELYIRALTTDMNNLESQKTDEDKEKIEETTKRLANGFTNLADILKENVQVSRECALTAFSLEPILERLQKIEDLARQSGFNVLDTGQLWECRFHPPVTPGDDLCWMCNACGKWMCKPNLDLRLTTNFALNEALNFEQLGISSQLCDDLAVILNGPRYHLLSWLLRWEDLHRLCEMYLNDMERTKNLVTDLKFVDIDYSMFATVKREPVDELAGIERGYEKFLYADINEKIGDSAEDLNPETAEIQQPKSDPNTLKSLRMFRHNIKRNKPQASQTNATSCTATIKSNNIVNSYNPNSFRNNNWLSNINPLRNSTSTSHRLPENPPQILNGFVNNLVQSQNGLCKAFQDFTHSKTVEGVIDYSATNSKNTFNSHFRNDTKAFNLGEFRSNLYKRKLDEQKIRSSQTSTENYRHNVPNNHTTNSNLLHDMISYELSRTNQQLKRSKQSTETSQPPNYNSVNHQKPQTSYTSIPENKLPPVSQLLSRTSKPKSYYKNSEFGEIIGAVSKTYGSSQHSNTQSSFQSLNLSKSDNNSNQSSNMFLKQLLSSSPACPVYDYTNNTKPQSIAENLSKNQPASKNHTTSKDQNHFFLNGSGGTEIRDPDPRSVLKRTDRVTVEVVVSEKKPKLDDQFKVSPLKNGLARNFEKEQNKITKVLTAENGTLKDCVEASVQNENSSKNANCCLPTSNEHSLKLEADTKHTTMQKTHLRDEKQVKNAASKTLSEFHIPVIDKLIDKKEEIENDKGPTSITETHTKSIEIPEEKLSKSFDGKKLEQTTTVDLETGHLFQNRTKTDAERPTKTSKKESDQQSIPSMYVKIVDIKKNGNKVEKSDNLTKTESDEKPVNPSRTSVKITKGKKNKNKAHKPLSTHNRKIVYASRITDDNHSNDLFKFEDTAKPDSKELKILVHRLSNEVIQSFIPSHEDDISHNCRCGCGDKIKKLIGRPRKFCPCCKQRTKKNVFSFSKYSARTQIEDVRRKNFIGRVINRNNGDIIKKTGKIVKKYGNKKKVLNIANHNKVGDSLGKPKNNKKSDIPKEKIETAMNPRVILERLPLDTNYVRSVLSNIPGLNDYEMLRPTNVDHIVNVVQISGGRSTSSVPVQNTQTSTQITPHIQRIGQPRSDKPEHNTNSETPTTSTTTSSSATSTNIKPSTSQSSTLINILSQQIIRPGQSNCVRSRTSPLINILSQQIIRPASTQVKTTTNSSDSQTTSNSKAATTSTELANEIAAVKTLTTTAKTAGNTPATGQSGTILQFICKSSLPKFQQAFGKTVYQNNTEGSDATNATSETPTAEATKKLPAKNSSVNIQPIQGSVIYTRQMPVGQTINLIPPGRGQVFRIATSNSDQISLVKDTVIHSKMSALLAAALQGKQKSADASDGENAEESGTTRLTVTRPTLVQNARIVKPVLQIPSNVIRTSPQSQSSNLSSTTLEQLREFDMVYKQIKERSSTSTPSDANTSDSNENPQQQTPQQQQRISVTYVNQGQKYTQLSPVVVVSSYCNLQPAASPALSVTSQGSSSPCVTPAPTPSTPKVSSKSSKGKTVKNTTTQASKSSPIPKPQQKPQEDEQTTQRIFDILAEYAEQLANSPDLNNKPAPRRRSNPPTNPSQNSKRKKSSSSKKSGQCSNLVSEAELEDHRTVGSEDSSCGVVQISVQEEEQSHIQTVTTESNDSTSSSRQQLILTEAGGNQTRNLIIADSSVGEALKMPNTAVLVPGNYIMPVSMVKGGQQIAVVSGGSKILATVPARSGPNMLLFQSFLNQNRNKAGLPTVKYSTIQPISGISSQNLTGVTGQPPVILPPNSHNLTAVTLGQPITLKKIDEADRVNTELLLAISQPRDNSNSTNESNAHPDSTNTISSTVGNVEIEETIVSDNSSEKVFHTYQKSTNTPPIATPVIAQTACANKDATEEQKSRQDGNSTETAKSEASKTLARVQSVLVTACTSNGPMLSHTPPRYRKSEGSTGTNNETSTKEGFLHNGEKQQNNNEQKHFQGNATYYQNKKKTANPPRLDRELHQLCLQRKQAALERELRLQKSLSEECEDLGVDEPSTSDLFPEADILFDSNHSPSFDQSSQDLVKRGSQDAKEEKAMTLFSDDDNSSSLRTDFLFESVEYQTTTTDLEYDHDQNQQLTNGQSSNASNASGSSCEDHQLQNCASMSDVTLNSPVSPDPYHENAPPSLNKYKFKYSNRRKGERHKQQSETWTAEVSSSEDTTGSTELGKSSSHSPESCTNKRSHSVSCDDELSDGSSYKVVRVAISKSDLLKDEESCEELHCEDDLDCSPSGRGARRSVKKMCSCCNGSQDGGVSRKRPTSRPHTPAPHKKAFLNKKR